jgi:hypothetical protein
VGVQSGCQRIGEACGRDRRWNPHPLPPPRKGPIYVRDPNRYSGWRQAGAIAALALAVAAGWNDAAHSMASSNSIGGLGPTCTSTWGSPRSASGTDIRGGWPPKNSSCPNRKASWTYAIASFSASLNRPRLGIRIVYSGSSAYSPNTTAVFHLACSNTPESWLAKYCPSQSPVQTINRTQAAGIFLSAWLINSDVAGSIRRHCACRSNVAVRWRASAASFSNLADRTSASVTVSSATARRRVASEWSSVSPARRTLNLSLTAPESLDPRRAKAISPATPMATAAPGQFHSPTSPMNGSRYSAATPTMTANPNDKAELSAIFAAVSIVSSVSLALTVARKRASLTAWAALGGLAFWSAIAALLVLFATVPA